MPDVTPNYQVEMQRLRAQIAQQNATIEGQRLAIMEMADRTERHKENITAALLAIETYSQQLTQLESVHAEGGLDHG